MIGTPVDRTHGDHMTQPLAHATQVAPWYPFNKNLSSPESLLFLSRALTFSPLEVLVAILFTSWTLSRIGNSKPFVAGRQFWAIVAFTVFIVVGYINGIGNGGDLRVGLFEGRALFLVLPIYVVVTNDCDSIRIRRLMWTSVAAIATNALLALRYFNQLPAAQASTMHDLGEHQAAVMIDVVFILVLALFLYRGASRTARVVLTLICVPVAMTFLQAQRRAAVVALIVGVLLVMGSAWWRARRKFLIFGPALLIGLGLYAAAFWNSTSSAGFPAQAIKTVIAPQQVSARDASSDVYRQIENVDTNYTIRQNPVLGIGFGQKFYRPIALADISFFEFYQYIPHNSILFIWMKMGFGGFFSMMAMFALAVTSGAAALIKERDPTKASLIMVGVAYVVMFAVFAFVDIAWVPQTMVFLGYALALCEASRCETDWRPDSSIESAAHSRKRVHAT